MSGFNPENKVKLALLWLVFVMPVLTYALGSSYFESVRKSLEQAEQIARTGQIAGEAPDYLDNEIFWTNLLLETVGPIREPEKLNETLTALFDKFQQKAGWIIIPDEGELIFSKNLLKYRSRPWLELSRRMSFYLQNLSNKPSIVDDYFYRRIFGPHLQTEKFKDMRTRGKKGLIETDFFGKFPLFWARRKDNALIIVLLPPSVVVKKHGLQEFLRKDRGNLDMYLLTPSKTFSKAGKLTPSQLQQLKKEILGSSGKTFEIDGQRVYGESLPQQSFLLTAVSVRPGRVAQKTALFALILAFFCLIIARSVSTINFIQNLKVRNSIFIFIGCSNIFPLLILAFFTNQYFEQKLQIMIDAKRVEAINFIRMIEEKFTRQIHQAPVFAKKEIKRMLPELKTDGMTLKLAKKFDKAFRKGHIDFNLIASPSLPVVAMKGRLTRKGFDDFSSKKSDKNSSTKLMELTGKIGGSFLAFWNEVPFSQKALTEAELVTEVVFQKPIDESLHKLIEIFEHIDEFGFGSIRLPSFSMVVSLNDSEKGDYVGIFQLGANDMPGKFLANLKRFRLHNAYGLKTIVGIRNYREYSEKISDDEVFAQIFERLKDYPPLKAEIVEMGGKPWISTGYRSSIIENRDLVAFYPMDEIYRRLGIEKSQFGNFFLANLLIVLSIALLLTRTLLRPVQLLEEGAHAIDRRNFNFRLPEMGEDEFGKMSDIFNEAIVDLQEMSVARVVQQSLFPQEMIETGNFCLFGKSETLADLGGDYLDYFSIDSENFGIILGDVAGHGVGAAMIMAMAKSATINSREFLKKPVDLTMRLHNLIYRTKTRKQKKIMTFQYLLVEKGTNRVKFCNAGGCNPFLVNGKENRVEEIALPAAALGAFKKGKFNEKEIDFNPGDVMVLYSDGIVEARNSEAEEIGYPRFKEMLLRCWTTDSEEFYRRVVEEYQAWLGTEPPQDDLSMVFLSLPAQNPIS